MGEVCLELANTIQVDIDFFKRENSNLKAKLAQL